MKITNRKKVVNKYLYSFLSWAGLIFIVTTVIIGYFRAKFLFAFSIAYVISLVFVGTNFFVLRKMGMDDNSRFFKLFGISFGARFLVVILSIVLVLKLVNIHEIFFTVSFIISYICHSAIEIIFMNKILETDTK